MRNMVHNGVRMRVKKDREMSSDKTKFDYELEEFYNAFHDFLDKKIVIYGTGRMTATLLTRNDRFNIIGLCDRDPDLIGTELYGVKVLSRQQAEEQADMVIINTGTSYWRTIYKRISDWKIPVFFRNGEQATDENNRDENNTYWNCSYEELLEAAEKCEVISFDVFDTVLIRKVMSPYDVFQIVEKKLEKEWGAKAENYLSARKLAATQIDNPTIEELFGEIQKITQWTDAEAAYVMECEIETEMALMTARKDIVHIYEQLQKKKDIYFISDMYYPAEIISRFLEHVGIKTDIDRIVVSCDKKKDKITGSLWLWYKQNIVKDRTAVHIGDNKDADFHMPQKYGIGSYYIMNVQAMLDHSSIRDISDKVRSLHSSIIMGCICARLFNSPFSLCKTKGKVFFKDEEEAGYSLFGALSYNFLMWLVKNAKNDDVEQLVFFARDGYLLFIEYNYLSGLLPEEDWMDALYLEISRRAIWGALAVDPEGIYRAAKFPYKGDAVSFLRDRFGITGIADQTLEKIIIADLQKDEIKFKEFLDTLADKISVRGKIENRNYLKYIEGKNLKKSVAVVDTSLYGSTQYFLQKLLHKSFKGYYMCACLDASNEYIPENDMKGCFQEKSDLSGKHCNINQYADFLESFYTAPNGMVMYIGEDGQPVYGETMSNQKHFGIRCDMEKGIFGFFEEIVDVYRDLGLNIYETDELFADQLFGIYMQDGFIPTDTMRRSFFYDNGLIHKNESPIWD